MGDAIRNYGSAGIPKRKTIKHQIIIFYMYKTLFKHILRVIKRN